MMISAFDVDKTLFKVNTSLHFGLHLYKKGIISTVSLFELLLYYALFCLRLLSTSTLHKKAFERFFHGRSKKELEEAFEKFIENECDKIIYPPAMERLVQVKAEGHYIAFLSNSPDFIVRAIAAKLHADEWAGTLYQVDASGLIEKVLQDLGGREKGEALAAMAKRQGVTLNECIAYSDSMQDLPFLESAGTAVVVNGERPLRKLARKNGWEML